MVLSPFACAGFLVTSMVVGGVFQSLWFAHPLSGRLSWPLDGGHTFRGRRIFGDNKTVRGFVVIVPATALVMVVLGALTQKLNIAIWPLSFTEFFLLGISTAFGLMLGELPNSFLKRQFGIGPGHPPRHRIGRVISAVADRLDSVVGALIGAALIVNLSWMTAAWCLVLGPPIHLLFSALLYTLGVKKRLG